MTLTRREKLLLRAVYDLAQRHPEVTPTMASDALGMTSCARIVETRKALCAKGLMDIRYIHRSKALLALTDAGAALARKIKSAPLLARSQKRKSAQRLSHGFIARDVPAVAGRPYRAEQWQTQRMNGRRYEDADVSGEVLDPFLPVREQGSGMTSAAQLCAEEGPE